MALLYLTFGVQYRADSPLDDSAHHPLGWPDGRGYLAVEYTDSSVQLTDADAYGSPLVHGRERARHAAWVWLGGRYAFDYDEQPSPEDCPLGEIARLVLP